MKNQRILITGASKGLGAVAAVAFAERGARLALLARSHDKLEFEVATTCFSPLCEEQAIAIFFSFNLYLR